MRSRTLQTQRSCQHFFLLSAMLILFLILPSKVRAEENIIVFDSGVYAGIRWEIDGVFNGDYYRRILKISGNGPIPDFSNPNDGCTGDILPPWLCCRWTSYEGETPDSYQKNPYFKGMGTQYGANFSEIIIGEGITSIGNFAFSPCTFKCSYTNTIISEIVIPKTVTKIGSHAFDTWRYLERVVIPDSVKEIVFPGTDTAGWGLRLVFDPHTRIVCSSSSAAYRYATQVGNPVELTDLKLSLTVNGSNTAVIKKGQTIPYKVISNVEPEIWINGTAVSLDQEARTLTAVEDGQTVTLSASAGGKTVSCTIKVLDEYTIRYDLDGGKNNAKNPASYLEGNTVRLKNPTRKKYKFLGWYPDYYSTEKITDLSGRDAYLIARWEKIEVPTIRGLKLKNKKTRKLVISFKKVKNAKGYQVQYSTKASFSKKSRKVKNVTKNKLTVTGLKKKKACYVRVRAWMKDSAGKKVYGSWCKPVKIKIKK